MLVIVGFQTQEKLLLKCPISNQPVADWSFDCASERKARAREVGDRLLFKTLGEPRVL